MRQIGKQTNGETRQRGAVSLFVVIFTALLVTVISVGFVNLMIQGQRQATTDDLSRSAYDSAQAGVEDAKRALVKYSEACSNGDVETCSRFDTAFRSNSCRTLQETGIAGTTANEVLIRQEEGDEALQQAYTCVTMETDSPDYIGTLDSDKSRVIPLRGVSDFNKITLEWFMQSDLQKDDESEDVEVNLPLETDPLLPKLSEWPANRPALIRSQLIQYGTGGFQLNDFDDVKDGKSNANTLFFYPSGSIDTGPDGNFRFLADVRKSQATRTLQQVRCDKDFARFYACKATIDLPRAIGQSNDSRNAYLRLNALYSSGNNFRIQLFNGTNPVKFAGVQATVDSTGRANDQFRRIQSRVELDVSSFPYPEAAVDITGNLCKTFLVTDSPADYNAGGCDPAAYTTSGD